MYRFLSKRRGRLFLSVACVLSAASVAAFHFAAYAVAQCNSENCQSGCCGDTCLSGSQGDLLQRHSLRPEHPGMLQRLGLQCVNEGCCNAPFTSWPRRAAVTAPSMSCPQRSAVAIVKCVLRTGPTRGIAFVMSFWGPWLVETSVSNVVKIIPGGCSPLAAVGVLLIAAAVLKGHQLAYHGMPPGGPVKSVALYLARVMADSYWAFGW